MGASSLAMAQPGLDGLPGLAGGPRSPLAGCQAAAQRGSAPMLSACIPLLKVGLGESFSSEPGGGCGRAGGRRSILLVVVGAEPGGNTAIPITYYHHIKGITSITESITQH